MISATLAAAALSMATVPETWVNAVQHIESGTHSRHDVKGDSGRAAGVFQFWRSAWDDCSKVRKARGEKTYPYSKANDPKAAREYARSWLSYLRARLYVQYGRPPNVGEVWLAYNLGFKGFSKYGYDMDQVPALRRDKAKQVIDYVPFNFNSAAR